MQILITRSSLARSRVSYFNRIQMTAALVVLMIVLSRPCKIPFIQP